MKKFIIVIISIISLSTSVNAMEIITISVDPAFNYFFSYQVYFGLVIAPFFAVATFFR